MDHLARDSGDSVDSKTYAQIRVPVVGEPNLASEGLWTRRIGGDRFEIANIPGWAKGLGFGDIVRAARHRDGLVFREVAERRGHSTYRLARQGSGTGAFSVAWDSLSRLGCHYEQLGPRMYAVDVPPEADIYEVYAQLEAGMSEGVWWFDELHCGHDVASHAET